MDWFKHNFVPAATSEELPTVLAEEQELRAVLFAPFERPEDVLKFYRLMQNITRQRDEGKMEALIAEVHERFPELEGLHREMIEYHGSLIAHLGDWRRAIPYFERYHDAVYDFEVSERRRMTAYIIEGLMELKDYTDIRTYIRRYVEYTREENGFEYDDESIPSLCELLQQLGEREWMLELALEWDAKSDYAPDTMVSYHAGSVLYDRGDALRAMHHFQRALEPSPEFFPALYYMGMIAWNDLDDKAQGLAHIESGCQLLEAAENPGSDWNRMFYRALQDMYFELDRLEESKLYQERFFDTIIEPLLNGETMNLHGDELETLLEYIERKYPGKYNFRGTDEDFSAN
jgi:tetratricopeptide (TPR) repeat protein